MKNLQENDIPPIEEKQAYPTCISCGYQNKNFPGKDLKTVCVPCQIKIEEQNEEHYGI